MDAAPSSHVYTTDTDTTPRLHYSPSFAATSPAVSVQRQFVSTTDSAARSEGNHNYEQGDTTLVGYAGGFGGEASKRFSSDDDAADADGPAAHERIHSFPPQPLSASSTNRTTPPPSSASNNNPYGSTAPRTMSAAAAGGPRAASPPNSLHDATSELNNQGQLYPRLPQRTSIHSQRSSVAPESVFGTAPLGVIGHNKPREIVRIERDYSGGELCQFWSGWIWELEGRVSPTEYQNTLNELNTVLASAHNPYKSLFDNTLAILTLYISPQILGSHYEREMKKFDKALEKANREIYNPAGLNILSPRRTAFLFIEIEYY
ncbi:hypothetical protein RQP46_003057 [Phenoliferia psychrophenolica]